MPSAPISYVSVNSRKPSRVAISIPVECPYSQPITAGSADTTMRPFPSQDVSALMTTLKKSESKVPVPVVTN